jgi:hypothetical protein
LVKSVEDEMVTTVKQMLEAANAAVPRITPAHARDNLVLGGAALAKYLFWSADRRG